MIEFSHLFPRERISLILIHFSVLYSSLFSIFPIEARR